MEKSIKKRFSERIKKTKYCWWWLGYTINTYGYLKIKGKHIRATELSLNSIRVYVPKKKFICHKCDNPSCVRPSHLFIGNNKSNCLDKIKKGRQYKQILFKTVRLIRKLYNSEGWTQRELAFQFTVSQSAIAKIVSYQTRKFS